MNNNLSTELPPWKGTNNTIKTGDRENLPVRTSYEIGELKPQFKEFLGTYQIIHPIIQESLLK